MATLALLLSGYGRSAVPRQPLVAHASNIGQIRTIVLADGSQVTLDTASRVMTSFSDERRISLLAGRARFTVAHEPGRPFIVVAGDQAVIARGTVFDVRLDGEDLEVVLLEGKVEIKGAGRDAGGTPPVKLMPGKRAVIGGAGKDLRIDVAPHLVAGWPAGMISAEGMQLADLIREANRYSRSPVVLAETGLGSLRVTGAFRPGNAQALGDALAEALDLSVVTRADGSAVLARKPV